MGEVHSKPKPENMKGKWRRLEDNTKAHLEEIWCEGLGRIHLAQLSRWRVVVKKITNFQIP